MASGLAPKETINERYQQNQVDAWNLSQLNPNRINYLAKIGTRATNQYLQRASEVRRYPILICFLKQSLYNFTDDLIEMVDQRLWELYNQAKRNFDSDRLLASKTIDQKLKTLQDIGQILLDQNIEDNSVRAQTFEYINPDELKVSLSETKQLIRPENDAYVDYFGKSYNSVRRFSGKFLATLKFQVRGSDSGLLKALNLVQEIHLGKRRKLPSDAPTDFIPEPWQAYVLSGKEVDRRYYELAALWLLRQQLRSGDIYIPQSRRFSELETYFIPKKEWSFYRDEFVNLTGTPVDAKLRLAEREIEHTTDTAGYTEVIFALFDLSGLRFSPRIRDLADQKLYRTSNINLDTYPLLKEHIQGIINQELIINDWDEMLRLVGSLKMGWVTASLIIQKLQAFPRKHPLMRALQEYGRLIKTIHLLRWYADQTNRRRLKRQLNKGEALHSLRSHLFYANQGELKTQQDDQLLNQVGCLNLVTNAIIVWNTVYICEVVQQLRQEGQSIDDEDLKYIWPTRHSNINVYGKYHFNLKEFRQKHPLRPLRNQGS